MEFQHHYLHSRVSGSVYRLEKNVLKVCMNMYPPTFVKFNLWLTRPVNCEMAIRRIQAYHFKSAPLLALLVLKISLTFLKQYMDTIQSIISWGLLPWHISKNMILFTFKTNSISFDEETVEIWKKNRIFTVVSVMKWLYVHTIYSF